MKDFKENSNHNYSTLNIESINHSYDNTPCLKGISFDVANGEIISLLGPSGSGKTTILRSIAGLEKINSGVISINNTIVSSKDIFYPPEKRNIGFVFQDYALFPHLTVLNNILFGLKKSDKSKAFEVMHLLGIEKLKNSFPHQISGGQQQRVALARAIAPSPKVILLDEPFVRLDIRLREKVRDEVLHLLKVSGTTAIIVTHEAEEAMFMSDRIVVINDGRLKQIGRPSDLYNRPKSKFVAEFFGEVNLIHGVIKNGKVNTLLGTFDSNGFDEGMPVNLIIRHEGIKLIDLNNDKIARAKVLETRLLGRFSLIHLQVENGKSKVHLHARVPGLSYLKPQSIIGIEIDSVQSYIFPI